MSKEIRQHEVFLVMLKTTNIIWMRKINITGVKVEVRFSWGFLTLYPLPVTFSQVSSNKLFPTSSLSHFLSPWPISTFPKRKKERGRDGCGYEMAVGLGSHLDSLFPSVFTPQIVWKWVKEELQKTQPWPPTRCPLPPPPSALSADIGFSWGSLLSHLILSALLLGLSDRLCVCV